MARLAQLAIKTTIHRHPAVYTVEESRTLRGDLLGAHIKNLFVRVKKRNFWLITVLEERQLDLKALKDRLDANGNLSFTSGEYLHEILGVEAGAVTPQAVMNDKQGTVKAVLDSAIAKADLVNVHPLHNKATLSIPPADLVRFMEDCGHKPVFMSL
ncbi:MAG: prolyl-tRNA synthetase associated domain-containing protein [Spirochaetota bacterium]